MIQLPLRVATGLGCAPGDAALSGAASSDTRRAGGVGATEVSMGIGAMLLRVAASSAAIASGETGGAVFAGVTAGARGLMS